MKFTRRSFIQTGATALGALALPSGLRSMGGSTIIKLDVLLGEPIGLVTRNHYGHFVEHLGGVIYDGVWVGEKSRIPNVSGIRKALIDDLKALTPGAVRWPGGCFADSYNWRDGIGPISTRPKRASFWAGSLPSTVTGPARYEPNHFGTREFLNFCMLIGAEPYLAANGRSRTPADFTAWVEYCNAPAGSTTLADLRVAHGSREPYNVQYWGVGNEPWGCGGTLAPEEYAAQYRKFAIWVPSFPGGKPNRLIAAGPYKNDEAWTERFLTALTSLGSDVALPWGYSLHTYFMGRKDALNFTQSGWYTLLKQSESVSTMLTRQAALLKAARIPAKLVLDEWGVWYAGTPQETGQTDPSHPFEQLPTMRDALLTAMLFDIFHAHADVLGMANVAQTINCIHSLFIAREEQFIRTPVYHAFALYQPHIGGTAVRTVIEAESIPFTIDGTKPESSTLPGISASATVHKASNAATRVVLTVTNPHISDEQTVSVRLPGATVRGGEVTVLTHNDPHGHNTFDVPNTVQFSVTIPLKLDTQTPSDTFRLGLPPASVTRIMCALGNDE